MASIESLLNPVPPGLARRHSERTRYSSNTTLSSQNQQQQDRHESVHRSHHSYFHHHRQQQQQQQTGSFPPDTNSVIRPRVPKDAPVYNPGKARGEVRYPPCEERDEFLAEQHAFFEIHPAVEHIADFPRHIPYSSEKKAFLEKTARESFEVYQYTFKFPGSDKAWTVMWDYNIGLVRTTHLFKCNEYSKTTPAKMLNANPGLREICHSITGGALAAQGYWMPYEAAKAVSATFCWGIRYALTPLFGKDFPSMCIPPESPQFGKMIIDHETILRSTQTANKYREMELESKMQTSRRQQQQTSPLAASFMRDRLCSPVENMSPNGNDNVQRYTEDNKSPITAMPSNSWTPINLLSAEQTKPTRHFEKKATMTAFLPPLKDMFGRNGSISAQANPLKRRLNENNIENAQPSSSAAPAVAGKPRTRVHRDRTAHYYESSEDDEGLDQADKNSDDDDDEIMIDVTTDNDSSSSESDDDLEFISDLSMLTSSDSETETNDPSDPRHRLRGRHHGGGRSNHLQWRKNRSNHTLSPTPSSPQPRRASSTVLAFKKKHHLRDREAAEALLALSSRSASSGVDESSADSEGSATHQDRQGQKASRGQQFNGTFDLGAANKFAASGGGGGGSGGEHITKRRRASL